MKNGITFNVYPLSEVFPNDTFVNEMYEKVNCTFFFQVHLLRSYTNTLRNKNVIALISIMC